VQSIEEPTALSDEEPHAKRQKLGTKDLVRKTTVGSVAVLDPSDKASPPKSLNRSSRPQRANLSNAIDDQSTPRGTRGKGQSSGAAASPDPDSDEIDEDDTAKEDPPVKVYVDERIKENHRVEPDKLPSWTEADNLSPHGSIIQSLSYDNDPKLRGNCESKPSSDQDTEQVGNADDEDQATQDQLLLASNDVFMQMSEELLVETCDFFMIDLTTARKRDASFSIKYFVRPLKIYQLYGIYWILKREQTTMTTKNDKKVSPCGVTVLADEMGFGKSAQSAGIIVVNAMLERAWRRVEDCRKSSDPKLRSRHNPGSQQSSSLNTRCPAANCKDPEDDFGICCPCVNGNPSNRLRPSTGIVILLVPNSLAINTLQEWYKQVDMVKNELGLKFYCQLSRDKSKREITYAYLDQADPNKKTAVDTMMVSEKAVASMEAKCKAEDFDGLSTNIFLTTRTSYKTAMKDTDVHTLICGRYISDEFHMEPSISNSNFQSALQLINTRATRSEHTLRFTFMSGTPVRMGARDFYGLAAIWTLCTLLNETSDNEASDDEQDFPYDTKAFDNTSYAEVDFWKVYTQRMSDPFWKDYTPWGLREMTAQWNDSKKKDAMKQKWKTLLMAVMIARTKGARWFDNEVILPLPRCHYHVVDCPVSKYRQGLIASGVEMACPTKPKGKNGMSKKDTTKIATLQKCYAAPGIADFFRRDIKDGKSQSGFKLDAAYMTKHKVYDVNRDNRERNIYAKHAKLFIRGSPKLRKTREILNWELERKDFLRDRRCGLIFCETNEIAFIVFMVS
jgi:hypothetical protein